MARKSSTKKKSAVKRQPRTSESAEPAQKKSTEPQKISKAELKKILGARRKWARDWLGIFVLATAFWLLLFLVTGVKLSTPATVVLIAACAAIWLGARAVLRRVRATRRKLT